MKADALPPVRSRYFIEQVWDVLPVHPEHVLCRDVLQRVRFSNANDSGRAVARPYNVSLPTRT